jgi:mannosyltransferase OCH1-like enzyme
MIPKIIHHIWMSDNKIPEINIYAANSVKENNKDFEYRLWKDEDVEYLMKTEFNEYYDKFNKLPRLIMKIDMFRYFLMYKFGGLYTDMDYLMFKPFDLLNYEIVIPANRDKDSNGNYTNLGNCIFASIPNHEFWKGLIDTLFTIDRQNQSYMNKDDVLNSTGPMFVFNMYKKYSQDVNNKTNKSTNSVIYVPERKYFHPDSSNITHAYINELKNNKITYGLHLCTGLWLNKNNNL